MTIGDERIERPSFFTTFGHGAGDPMACRVIWIHPLRRFYRVRFTAPASGQSWTECYYFADRRGNGEERTTHEDDCDHE